MQRTIIILGMHRSGTSALTGSLEEAGLFLGDVIRKAPYNLKGNCENQGIMEMHASLLAWNGGSWDNPPEKVVWDSKHRKIRDAFIAGFQLKKIWGFKDPRTLCTIQGWLEVLPHAEFVGIFRDPMSVAKSLNQRDRMPIESALELWALYNKRLIRLQKEFRFPLIYFNPDAIKFRHSLERLCRSLDLPQANKKKTFFEDRLRNHTNDMDGAVPRQFLNILKSLQDVAI